MRATLFLSALFAVSLVGGAALAERPSDGSESKRPSHDLKLQDLRPHDSTVRETHVREVHVEKATHAPAVVRELPNRADNVDRSYSRGGTTTTTMQKGAPATGVMPANKTYESKRNCSDVGNDCSASTAKAKGNSSDQVMKSDKQAHTEMTRAQVQQLMKIIHEQMCKNMAGACADYL